ncbi:glycosyltransferase [bacterium]|nr:glycosyltransferase [bacterium]
MNTIPSISVLLCVYNGEDWLSESLRSILNQTFVDFELIVVSDGSTDNTNHIINEFSSADGRVKPFFKANTGLADSLNVGLNNANAQVIARLDADDLSHPRRLELQFDYFNQHKQVVLLGSWNSWIDSYGRVIGVARYPNNCKQLLNNLLTSKAFFVHSSVMFDRQLALELGGYRSCLTRCEDHDLWLRMSLYGNISCLPINLAYYRLHQTNISNLNGGSVAFEEKIAAVVAYFIYSSGYGDPLATLQNDKFIAWVASKVSASGMLKNLHMRCNLQSCRHG